MWRNISSIISMLIILAVVMTMGFMIGVVIPEFIQAQTPKKGILAISGTSAIYDSATDTLWIVVSGVYQGVEQTRIVGVKVLVPDSVDTIPVKIVSGTDPRLNPNSYFKIILKASMTQAPEKIHVIIDYCFEDGTCQASAGTVEVRKN